MALIRAGLAIRLSAIAVFGVCWFSSISVASEHAVPLADRIQGADVVVVATAASVSASWRDNEFGDRLIVSRYVLQVQETLKGVPGRSMLLDVEGGTLDGFTLRVSSLPTLAEGERAVFILDAAQGAYHAHLKGLGILKLDEQDVVRGSSLSLAEIRRVAGSVEK
jgi:hypothetical protein